MARIGLLYLVLGVLGIAGILMGFNYWANPYCNFRCQPVVLGIHSGNSIVKSFQIAIKNSDKKVAFVSTSRGERFSASLLENRFGQPSVNLSQPGGDVMSKIALLHFAEESGIKFEHIVWFADFHELMPLSTDPTVRKSDVVYRYLPDEERSIIQASWYTRVLTLLDHQTLEAAFALMNSQRTASENWEIGNQWTRDVCMAPDFRADVSEADLEKKMSLVYGAFAKRFLQNIDERYFRAFQKEILRLKSKGTKVTLVLGPIPPQTLKRMQEANPLALRNLKDYTDRVRRLQQEGVDLIDGSDAFDSQGTALFWEDAMHFSCRGAFKILER